MRKIVLIGLAAMSARCVFGIAASQAWVTNYVAQAIAGSKSEAVHDVSSRENDGVMVFAYGDVVFSYEIPSDAALLATNCLAQAVSAGVTNGCTFVWNGAGAYVNPLGSISCTATNLVWDGVASFPTNGVERFGGWFDVQGILIQPHTSLSITNGITEVTR